MTYSKKTWIDRVTEFAGRRKLTPTGVADTYDVSRAEGNILAAGDPINAAALNDLETRVENGLNEKIDITRVFSLPTTTGTSSAYVVAQPGFTLTRGQTFTAQFHVAGTGTPTAAVQGTTATPLKKSDGSTAFLPKSGGSYTFVFDGSNFVLQGEGASGNATASDLLSGKTATTDAGEITGTLSLTGDALAANVLAGKTFYNTDPKTKVTGTIASKGVATITPSTANQTIAAGQYLSGDQTILGDTDLIAGNIKSGVNIFGVAGTLPDGTGLKKVASGTTTTIAISGDVKNRTGNTETLNSKTALKVTGLNFIPSLIEFHGPGSSYVGVYRKGANIDSGQYVCTFAASYPGVSATNYMEYGLTYSIMGEFQLPILDATARSVAWIAYE